MLLPEVLYPRLFTYYVGDSEEKRTTEAHLCVLYPVSPSFLTAYFSEVIGGNLVLKQVVSRVTSCDGGVNLRTV